MSTTDEGSKGMDTDTKREAQVEDYAQAMLSGRTFANAAASHRSRFGYEPPVSRRDYAEAMGALAKMASESDALAQVAAAIIGRVNLYGTDSQAAAKMWEAAGEALAKGYDDVIGRAAPDASGPRRLYERDYRLSERVAVYGWLTVATAPFNKGTARGYGWALVALAERERVRLPDTERR